MLEKRDIKVKVKEGEKKKDGNYEGIEMVKEIV